MFRLLTMASLLLLGLGLGACGTSPDDDDDTPAPPEFDGIFAVPDEEVVCPGGGTGMAVFSEESQERGLIVLTEAGPPGEERGEEEGEGGGGPIFGSGLADIALVAQDMDGDGDIDVLVTEAKPTIYENDGDGFFTLLQVANPSVGGTPLQVTALDLDGDALPEIIGSFRPFDPAQEHSLVLWRNLGGLEFSMPEFISTGYVGPSADASSMSFGDINGDGWLDIHHAKRNLVPDTMGAYPEQVFLGSANGFSSDRVLELSAYSEPAGVPNLVSLFTDRDRDGDQDLFVLGGTPEWGPPTPGCAFFRNDGLASGEPSLVNDATSVGIDLFFSAMGIDSADLNGDGVLDYCATDVGPPICFFSDGSGSWFEGSAQLLGLVPTEPVLEFPETIGWSLDFRDLDNDGWLDVLQASAPDHGGIWAGADKFPDLLWKGNPDGTFTDITEASLFGTDHDHLGMVSADFDGDGFLDILFHAENNDDIPRLFMNSCGAGHWVILEFVGPPENSEGIGALVEFSYGSRSQLRELYALRATAQGPSRVHQGLGEDPLVDILVTWPDGVRSRATNVPANRIVTVIHPDANWAE